MENFGLDVEHDDRAKMTVGYLFAYCGVIGAVVQGGLIGRMVKRFGEPALIAGSLAITAVSLALIPLVHCREPLDWGVLLRSAGLPWIALLVLLALLSIGTGLTRPPLFGLLSNLTSAEEQGVTIGVAQGAGSLARIAGPVFAASLFFVHPTIPYAVCGGILLVTGIVLWRRLMSLGITGAHQEVGVGRGGSGAS